MNFLENTDIIAGQIPEAEFAELEEYVYAAIEKRDPLGDTDDVSSKEEYTMEIPPKFELWLSCMIYSKGRLHTEERGFYGIQYSHFTIDDMWTTVMSQGDVHHPHTHNKCLYSFVAYIDTNDGDAPFYFIKDNMGKPINIDRRSKSMIMIFPSTMIHTVFQQTTDLRRVSVSGNISVRIDT